MQNQNDTTNKKLFGHQLKNEFMIDNEYTNVNVGSFGLLPKAVYEAKIKYLNQSYEQPDKWHRYEVIDKIQEIKQILSERINSYQKDDILVVQNITEGINSVLNSQEIWNWEANDVILNSNISYGMVQEAINAQLQKQKNLNLVNSKVTFTEKNIQTQEQIFNAYKETVEQLKEKKLKIKCAIIDHVSSAPAFIFPVQKIVEYLKSEDIIVIVDAAHSMGNVKVDIQKIKPDFFISNLHKWCFAPTSSAFLYYDFEKYDGKLKPSNAGLKILGEGTQASFQWTGTRDHTNFLSIKEAFQFIDKYGHEEIMLHNNKLAQQVQTQVSQIWNTDALLKDLNQVQTSMVCIKLPTNDSVIVNKIVKKMMEEDKMFIQTFQFDNSMYVRFSCQVINEIQDYLQAAELFSKHLNIEKTN